MTHHPFHERKPQFRNGRLVDHPLRPCILVDNQHRYSVPKPNVIIYSNGNIFPYRLNFRLIKSITKNRIHNSSYESTLLEEKHSLHNLALLEGKRPIQELPTLQGNGFNVSNNSNGLEYGISRHDTKENTISHWFHCYVDFLSKLPFYSIKITEPTLELKQVDIETLENVQKVLVESFQCCDGSAINLHDCHSKEVSCEDSWHQVASRKKKRKLFIKEDIKEDIKEENSIFVKWNISDNSSYNEFKDLGNISNEIADGCNTEEWHIQCNQLDMCMINGLLLAYPVLYMVDPDKDIQICGVELIKFSIHVREEYKFEFPEWCGKAISSFTIPLELVSENLCQWIKSWFESYFGKVIWSKLHLLQENICCESITV